MQPDKIEFMEGGIRVIVEARRSGGGDWGVTFRVFGDAGEKKVELLRFDCFKKNPHYHYDPAGKSETHNFDCNEIPNPLTWVMRQLGTRLPALIEHAGYDDIAGVVDQAAIAEDLARLEPDIVQLHDRALRELAVAG